MNENIKNIQIILHTNMFKKITDIPRKTIRRTPCKKKKKLVIYKICALQRCDIMNKCQVN